MCVLVNGIIRLIESVCLGPKVIPLSGAHCIKIDNIFLHKAIKFFFLQTYSSCFEPLNNPNWF